jgi:hypothetical protein
LTQALEKEKDALARRPLAEGLAAVAGRLESPEAARVCTAAARVLTQALEKEKDALARRPLAEGLAAVAGRLESAEAARVCAAAAHILTQALEKEKDALARQPLAEGLASVAGRLEPAEAARLLTQALEKEKDALARRPLAEGLASVAGRLEPAEAARLLTQVFEKETDAGARESLAAGLASAAGRLEPAEASRIGKEAMRSLLHRLMPDPRTMPSGDLPVDSGELTVLSTLLQQVDVEGVGPLMLTLARQTAGTSDAWGLTLVLADATRLPVRRRAVALVAGVGTGAGGPLAGLPFLPAAREPFACRLGTQDLVDLLKLPTCVREVRRVVLDHLGNRYGRRFDTHWDFVRYAQEQGLNLDFTTPPKRPDAKLPPLFEE